MNNLQLTIQRNPIETQVKVEGNLESIEALNLRHAITELVPVDKDLILDLTAIRSIGVTGFNALLMTQVALRKQNSKCIIIVEETSPLFSYMQITKLRDAFTIQFSTSHRLVA